MSTTQNINPQLPQPPRQLHFKVSDMEQEQRPAQIYYLFFQQIKNCLKITEWC